MTAALAKPLAALALAATLIALVLLAFGASPAGVFAALASGAFGSRLALAQSVVKATPLVFTGLAVALAFQGALWNIGAEGQLLVGALVTGGLGTHVHHWPRPLALAMVLGAGAMAGGLWGALAGWLKVRRGVNEVISTIMLNFVGAEVLSWAVHGPLMEASRGYPTSDPIAPSAWLYTFLPPSRLNAGIVLALALAPGCYVWLFHTAAGFELRALGKNARAASFFGIPIATLTIATMALSGGLAGLGGAVQVSAISHRLYERLSPGWGYEAIAVALLARLNPLGVLLTALLFGALDNGAQAMQRTQGVSPVLVQMIQAMVIFIMLAFDTPAASGLGRAGFGSRPRPAPEPGADVGSDG